MPRATCAATMSDERPPVGYGLPAWLDTNVYLNAEETRALGEFEYGRREACSRCGQSGKTEGAHIVRKGMGGKPKGTTGPRVVLCFECHDLLDDHANLTLAVKRGTNRPVWLEYGGEHVNESELRI